MPAKKSSARGKGKGKKSKPADPPSDVAVPAGEIRETPSNIPTEGSVHSRSLYIFTAQLTTFMPSYEMRT